MAKLAYYIGRWGLWVEWFAVAYGVSLARVRSKLDPAKHCTTFGVSK